MGETLRISQGDVHFKGHAIECRINAEDPFDDFRLLTRPHRNLLCAGWSRRAIDSHAYAGYTIPSQYDSPGKLITYGKDRREAMDKMSRALSGYDYGIKTTIPFEQAILQDRISGGSLLHQLYRTALGGARRELIEEKA